MSRRGRTLPNGPIWSERSCGPSTSCWVTRSSARRRGPTLAAEFEDRQLMDIVFTVGAYDVLAMALRTFAVPLDDDLTQR